MPSTSVQQVFQTTISKSVSLYFVVTFFNLQVRINRMASQHCHLIHQCFRITLKDTTSISLDPIGLSSLHNFVEFSHKPVYPTMVVKHVQIYSVHISRKCKKKPESRPFYYSRQIFLWFLSSPPRQRQITYSPQLRRGLRKPISKCIALSQL